MSRIRLDQMLVERNLAESREKAQRLIRAGRVRVAGQVASKPGHDFPGDVEIAVSEGERFVSRGGEKLEAAFECFKLDVKGLVCLDVGASTGGFTDCLLQHGASRVFAVDVGKGQLHWKLRQDPRVTIFDEVNARYMKPDLFPVGPEFAVVDVAFISLTNILPAVNEVLRSGSSLVTLIKPQFEAGREQVGKGGVVRDPEIRRQVVEKIHTFGVEALSLEWLGSCESPIHGPAGNLEFLAWWKKT